MARISNKILKDGGGSIGGMVIYTVDGKTYARSRPDEVNDPKTPAQLAQRRRMVLVMDFLKPFKELLKFTFPGEPGKRSGYFAAKSWNLKHGLKGTYPGILIDQEQALLCHGTVPLPTTVQVTRQAKGLFFIWSPEVNEGAGASDDTLLVIAGLTSSHESDYQFTGVKRNKGYYLWQPDLPMEGEEMNVWVAFRRSDQVAMSDSWYLGEC